MGNSTYECWSCQKRFGTQYGLYHHKQDKHGAGGRSSGSSSNFCSRCNYYFENAAKLRTHIDNGHPHESSFAPGRSPDVPYCYQCGGAFGSGLELKNHISLSHPLSHRNRSDHRSIPSSASRNQSQHPSSIYCKPCDYHFQYNSQLQKHIALGHPYVKHLALRRHVCKECDRGFESAEALRSHGVSCSHITPHQNPQAMIDSQRSLRPTEGSFPLQYRNNGTSAGGGSLVAEKYTPRLNPNICSPQAAGGPVPTGPSAGSNVSKSVCPLCSKKFKKPAHMEMHLASKVHAK